MLNNNSGGFASAVKTLFNKLLPTQGGNLYSKVTNPNVGSQTLTMDGRTVDIYTISEGVCVDIHD